MIGYRYPVQGLQPFTKTFGQPLHEPDCADTEVTQSGELINANENNVDSKDPEYVASQIEKSMRFSYESDGDESDASNEQEDPAESHSGKNDDDDDTFLNDHSDILPIDAPVETINTLKALKYHIESSENRCFTNLERQLLATIVQHGIFNANKNDSAENQAVVVEKVKEQQNTNQGTDPNMESSEKQQLPISATQIPPGLEGNYSREQTPDSQLISRKALLPTPGSYDEASHDLMVDSEGSKLFTKTTLPITEQKKMSKAVQSLKISEKLTRIQKSYHPDDEPTLQLFESMASTQEEDSGFDDLLASYTKSKAEGEKEPKYKSKTKILPPSSSFLKRQEKQNAAKQERYEKFQNDSHHDSHGHGSRRVVSREDYKREKRGEYERKNNEKEINYQYSSKGRRVKLNYKEDKREQAMPSAKGRSYSYHEADRKRSRSPDPVNEGDNKDGSSDEKAVDMLANLITQKFLSSMTESPELPCQLNAEQDPDPTISPPSTASHSTAFPPPTFITAATPAPFLPPPPILGNPIISVPQPIITGPMMVHPGPVPRADLIKINLNGNKKQDTNEQNKKGISFKLQSTVKEPPIIIDLENDIEEGEIS